MLCVNGAQPYSAGNEKGDMREGIPFMPPSVRTAGAVYIHGMASLIAVPSRGPNPVAKANCAPKPAAKSHRQSLSRPSAGLLTALSEYGGNRPGAEISTALCYVKSFCFKVRMV